MKEKEIMRNGIPEIPLNKIALFTGIGYLIIFITGIYSNFVVLENLVIQSDPAVTSNNIINNDFLFRTGIGSFILMVVFDVLLAWTLYLLLEPVNKKLSLLTGWLRLVNSTIFGIALFNLLSVQHILNGSENLLSLSDNQIHAHVMVSIRTFNDTWLIGLVFFGLHLMVLGYLIFKSDYMPKIIGILLMIASFGYLLDSVANFLLSNYSDYQDIFLFIVLVPGIIGELSLTLWLIIKGRKLSDIR